MKDVIKNNGSKKYLQLDAGKKTAEIRWDKADIDAAWDGISGYITNSVKPAGEVVKLPAYFPIFIGIYGLRTGRK